VSAETNHKAQHKTRLGIEKSWTNYGMKSHRYQAQCSCGWAAPDWTVVSGAALREADRHFKQATLEVVSGE
jgi:hypothetical protein